MLYAKKVLIFSEAEKGFTVRGKQIFGVLKLEKAKGQAEATLYCH